MGAAPGVVAIAEGRPNRAVTLNLLDDLPDIPRRISVSLRTQPPSPGRRARPAAEHWLATGTNLPRAFFMRGGHEELLLTPAGTPARQLRMVGSGMAPTRSQSHEVGTNRLPVRTNRARYQSRTKWVPIAHEVGTNQRPKWVPIAHEVGTNRARTQVFRTQKDENPQFPAKSGKVGGSAWIFLPRAFFMGGEPLAVRTPPIWVCALTALKCRYTTKYRRQIGSVSATLSTAVAGVISRYPLETRAFHPSDRERSHPERHRCEH